MKQFYVYIHKKPDGTPFYVGKSSTDRHKTIWRKHNKWHTRIVEKYGPENIIVEVTQCQSEANAFELEKIYIKQLRQDGCDLVNVTDGGEGVSGFKQSAKQIELNRQAKVGNTYRRGSKHTEKAKEKNRKAHLGKKQTTQTIAIRVEKLAKPRKSKHGISMVYWYKSGKRWVAKINDNGWMRHLGYFDSYLDACAARKSAELVVYKDKLL